MIRLAMILYAMIGTTLAGSAVVVVLSLGMVGWVPIIAASVLGFLAAVPAALIVAKLIQQNLR